MDQSSKVLDSSYIGLKNEQPLNYKVQRKKLPKLKTQQNQTMIGLSPKKQDASPTRLNKQRKIPPGYEMANYDKSIGHWHEMSYSKKIIHEDGTPYYEQYSIFDDLSDLKQYGLGIYLYMEFIKRLLIACFIISILMILEMYINYNSDGLSTYKQSFTLTLAKFTLGNLNEGSRKQYIMQSACDVLSMFVMFAFYFQWRSFHNAAVDAEEKDLNQLDPAMYAISIVGFDPKTPNLEEQLKNYFDTIYRGAYQVQVVHNFKRNFDKFIQYEEFIEKVAKQKQVLRQTDKANDELLELEKELQEKQAQLTKISNDFDPIYAIVHFRNLKSKYAFINVCKKYALVDKTGYSIQRCLCCMPGLPQRLKFNKRDDIMIKNSNLPKPDEINWNNIDITGASYVLRFVLSILFIIISIFITSSAITILTLYVATSSNCGNFDSETPFSSVQGTDDKLTIYCFCSANYASIYTDTVIEAFCTGLETTILINNIVQIAASLLSTITNIILILIVSVIAEKLMKPHSKPEEYNFIFLSVFLSNLINSTILPLFLNGDIFGFKSVTYLRFISFINFNNVSVFNDFDRNWFAVISPYYTNFFLIASISPLIQIIVYSLKRKFILWRLKKKCDENDPSNPTIQKEANQLVCMFPIDLPTEMAVLCVQFFMCFMYSSLIPLAIPIFTFGLILSFFCKRYIVLNYTKRIPADHRLNWSIINIIPFILLVHGIFGVWARTAPGVFHPQAFFYVIDVSSFGEIVKRAITDIILLGATALVAGFIVFDFTILLIFNKLRQACKDQLQLPVSLAAFQNLNYAQRLHKTNIVGSYRLVNNPFYKHPYNAYMELMKRVRQQKNEQQLQKSDEINLNFGSQPSSLNLNSVIQPQTQLQPKPQPQQ